MFNCVPKLRIYNNYIVPIKTSQHLGDTLGHHYSSLLPVYRIRRWIKQIDHLLLIMDLLL